MRKKKFSFERYLMHTIIRISVISDQGTVFTNDKLEEAFDQFTQVTRKYTRFDKTSELSQLNNSSNGKAIKVSLELFELIEQALFVAKETDGLFDPTIIDLLEAYGYGAKADFAELNNPKLMQEIKEILLLRKSYKQIKLDREALTVQLAPNQRLDLGGIAKGYAIDLAQQTLIKSFDSFIINAGGDIRANGKKEDGNPWVVALEKAPQFISKEAPKTSWGNIELNDMAIAASGAWSRKIKFFHHLVNPKTGLPVEDTVQVFTLAKNATLADIWATALFMMGKDGISLAVKNNIECCVIDKERHIYKSDDFPF
jgi:thiamine biosynthesis lipoprotein